VGFRPMKRTDVSVVEKMKEKKKERKKQRWYISI
jgi:hypothetical protein